MTTNDDMNDNMNDNIYHIDLLDEDQSSIDKALSISDIPVNRTGFKAEYNLFK